VVYHTVVTTFRALLVTKDATKESAGFVDLDRALLPPGEVLIRISHSCLNYKDGLAVSGKPGVIRNYPMVAGIDFAGVVEESLVDEFCPGEEVIVTGCGTSETMWGGYAEYARIDAKYVVPLPASLTREQAMAIGTAGFTAMQAVMALEQHGLSVRAAQREVLVTGASGGVGSVAIAILSALGYRVAASTGRASLHEYLRSLGATSIIDRAELSAPSKRPLDSERWAAAIDSVGGDTLAGVLRSVEARGSVAACGLAGGAQLHTTVFPFILRGVNLLGIDSPKVDKAGRLAIWRRLATDLPFDKLAAMTEVRPLADVFEQGAAILAGNVRGRVVFTI
jgi:acrylyl-CoA reductase (NADPH)